MTEEGERLRVTICDGKYTVVMAENGGLRALRYGEEWRDCVGDGLILGLAHEVEELREALVKCINYIKGCGPLPPELAERMKRDKQ